MVVKGFCTYVYVKISGLGETKMTKSDAKKLGCVPAREDDSMGGGRPMQTRVGTGKDPGKVPASSNKKKISNAAKKKANHKVTGRYKEKSAKDVK